jgi:hypothetical protein
MYVNFFNPFLGCVFKEFFLRGGEFVSLTIYMPYPSSPLAGKLEIAHLVI